MTVSGFDSWGWDGKMPEGYDYKYVGMNFSLFSQPFRKHSLFDTQWNAAKTLGLGRIPYCLWRYTINQENHAAWIADNLPKDLGFPVALDFEDRGAIKGLRSVERIAQWGRALHDALDGHIMIYTARWWWDSWIKPYDNAFSRHGWSPYDYPLWEADPPPDSPIAGRWTKRAIRQVLLDWQAPGFNAKIDVNQMEEDFYNKYAGGGPPPSDPREEIEGELTGIAGALFKIRRLLEEI